MFQKIKIISIQLENEQLVFNIILLKENIELISHNENFGSFRTRDLISAGYDHYGTYTEYFHPKLMEKMDIDYQKNDYVDRYHIRVFENNEENKIVIVFESFFNIVFRCIHSKNVEKIAYLTPAIKEVFKKEDSFTIEKIENYNICGACNSMNEANKNYCETCGMPIEKDFMRELEERQELRNEQIICAYEKD